MTETCCPKCGSNIEGQDSLTIKGEPAPHACNTYPYPPGSFDPIDDDELRRLEMEALLDCRPKSVDILRLTLEVYNLRKEREQSRRRLVLWKGVARRNFRSFHHVLMDRTDPVVPWAKFSVRLAGKMHRARAWARAWKRAAKKTRVSS